MFKFYKCKKIILKDPLEGQLGSTGWFILKKKTVNYQFDFFNI